MCVYCFKESEQMCVENVGFFEFETRKKKKSEKKFLTNVNFLLFIMFRVLYFEENIFLEDIK